MQNVLSASIVVRLDAAALRAVGFDREVFAVTVLNFIRTAFAEFDRKTSAQFLRGCKLLCSPHRSRNEYRARIVENYGGLI